MKANPWLDEQNAKFNQSRDLVAIADRFEIKSLYIDLLT